MANEFVIDSGRGRRAIFEALKRRNDGYLESYRVSLESPLMRAIKDVENSPYDVLLHDWFQDLANHWNGWDGDKKWNAVEGEMFLIAKMSKLGHVGLKVTLNVEGAGNWTAIAHLGIEAGQLEKIAKEAKQFFTGHV